MCSRGAECYPEYKYVLGLGWATETDEAGNRLRDSYSRFDYGSDASELILWLILWALNL